MNYYMSNFCKKFNIDHTKPESVFAFFNELMLARMQKDLEMSQLHINEYFNPAENLVQNRVTPEYFIKQISDSFSDQFTTSKQLKFFIPSDKYNQKRLYSQFHLRKKLIEDIIDRFEKSDTLSKVLIKIILKRNLTFL